MRLDIPAPTGNYSRIRSVSVTLYAVGKTPYDMIAGTQGAGTPVAQYVKTCVQTHDGATLRMVYPRNGTLPVANQCISFAEGGYTLFQGVIESVTNARDVRGTDYSIDVVVRRRDALPTWREVKRVTNAYTVGTELGAIARDVASALLNAAEVSIGRLGLTLAHDQVQFPDLPLWDTLRNVMLAASYEPMVNALGVLYAVSRDVRRPATYTYTSNTLIKDASVSRSTSPPTAVRVRYVDHSMVMVEQAERVLVTETLTCGFFAGVAKELWWSPDKTQRAKNVRLRVKQSVNQNAAILGLADAKVTDTEALWVNGYWYGLRQGTQEANVCPQLSNGGTLYVTPDIQALTFGELTDFTDIDTDFDLGLFGLSFDILNPLVAMAEKIVSLVMAMGAVGTGVYEITGQPVDWVYAMQDVEVYDIGAPAYSERVEVIDCNVVPNEESARALASVELLYRSRLATGRGQLVIADDPRVEPGDIFSLPDGRRFYTLGYSRDLTRGAEALLTVEGFFV